MKNFIKLFAFIAILAIFVWNCEKPTQPDQATGRDVKNADLAVSDIFTFSNGETDEGGKAFLDSADDKCYTVELDTNDDGTFTTTIEFDGTECSDGVVRAGKIIITWMPGWRINTGKYATVTFDNFTRDGNSIDGNLKIYREDLTSISYKMEENDMSFTYADGKKVTWSGWRSVEFIAGFASHQDKTDDIKIVNFERSGTNSNGEDFTANGENLTLNATCGSDTKITKGTITIIKGDVTTVVDFGDGECDNTYTITQNGTSIEVSE